MGARPQGSGRVAEVIYDLKEQLEKIEESLLPGETVEAVFDLRGSGTGFIGITDKRIIVLDKAFLRRMKAVVSVPYSRILSVATEDRSGLFTGRGFFATSNLVVVHGHGELEMEFRGADK